MTQLADYLNRLPDEQCRTALEKCCASAAWVDGMLNRRPFENDQKIASLAKETWNSLRRDDWLEAFAAHPRIGDVDSLRAKFTNTEEWADREQSGVAGASEDTLRWLEAGNRAYEAKFGYIFIVFATGKSADQMLAILERRLENPPEVEWKTAAAEQLKITQLRLRKLITEHGSRS